jgi:hypothetical protein
VERVFRQGNQGTDLKPAIDEDLMALVEAGDLRAKRQAKTKCWQEEARAAPE